MPRNMKKKKLSLSLPEGGTYELNEVFSADRVCDPGLSSCAAATEGRSSPQGRLSERKARTAGTQPAVQNHSGCYLGSLSGRDRKYSF